MTRQFDARPFRIFLLMVLQPFEVRHHTRVKMKCHSLFNHRDRAEPTRVEHRILLVSIVQHKSVIRQQLHRRRLKIEIVKVVRRNPRFEAVHNIHDDFPLFRSQLVKRFDQIVAKAKLIARLGKR